MAQLVTAPLALVGLLTQASVAAHRRQTRYVILRTLGLSERRLTAVLTASRLGAARWRVLASANASRFR